MTKNVSVISTGLIVCALFALSSGVQPRQQQAQDPAGQPEAQNLPAKPDSPNVLAHIEKAKKTAGNVWPLEERVLCENLHVANAADPGPVKLFDNLYVIPGTYGTANGVIFIITTSDGLLMIDSGWQKDVQSVLLPGLKTLGFDPVNIKLIILTHRPADHYGGATYLQAHYGTHVAMSAADWDLVAKPLAPRPGFGPLDPPNKDIVAVEGRPITVGDEIVTPVFIPGHTPGSLGLIFPVKDAGETHVVGIVRGARANAAIHSVARSF